MFQRIFHDFPSTWMQMVLGGIIIPLMSVMFIFLKPSLAQNSQALSANEMLASANTSWLKGSHNAALETLEEGIKIYPDNIPLQKLRGDILTTIRQNDQALEIYEKILQEVPDSLNVRWAKWSVLLRMGKGEEAIHELKRIAQEDAQNPLAHLRLAQELRKLDRLEESVQAYRQAVNLVPELPGWRLSLARALFDVLDYEEARKEVEKVLRTVPRGSSTAAAAKNLMMVVYGATKERGRRFKPIFSPDATASDRKEWALIRHEAWKLYASGRYQEAEPVLREVLNLRPTDYRASYELGRTLMELSRCEEAIPLLQKGIDLGPTGGSYSEMFLDSIFRIGQCLAQLERWQEALFHFELLQEIATVPQDVPEKSTESNAEGVPENSEEDSPPLDIPLLDREKVVQWLDRVRQHVEQVEPPTSDSKPVTDVAIPSGSADSTDEEFNHKPPKVLEPVYARASLMGRDADFSWFRYVIPAQIVMRDDLLAGTHEFIPIKPGNTFLTTQNELYLVFALVTSSYDEVPLTAECFLERSALVSGQAPLASERVVMSMNEQYGYFRLQGPLKGWPPGLYRCSLYVGDEVSAYNLADEARFRIVESQRQTSTSE